MSMINDKVLEVLSSILNISIMEIPKNAAPGVFEKWDSLKHIMFVMALEEEFEISFTDDELTDLLSLELIVEIISEKVGDKIKND